MSETTWQIPGGYVISRVIGIPTLLLWLCLVRFLCPAHAGEEGMDSTAPSKTKPAKMKVKGYGFWGNLELRRTLRLLRQEDQEAPWIDSNTIEDGALMILSKVRSSGYLRPQLTVRLTLENGETAEYPADLQNLLALPDSIRASRVIYDVHPGQLYRYGEIHFDGLATLSESEARAFFVAPQFIIPQKSARVFTPAKLQDSEANLQEALARRGYQDAKVTHDDPRYDHDTGRVDVNVHVEEGEQYTVQAIRKEIYYGGEPKPDTLEVLTPGVPYSKFWRQDFIRKLKNEQYRKGYPDTEVEIVIPEFTPQLSLIARVRSGYQYHVGEIDVNAYRVKDDVQREGRTRERAIRRRIPIQTGDLLDRLAVQEGRLKLARMGVFDRVNVAYSDSPEPYQRNVRYDLRESKPLEFSVFAGYGSYELLMGGLEISHRNVFGLGHRWRLFGKQSFKSTQLETSYGIDDLFGSRLNFSATGFYLLREEISFTREERGGHVGVKRSFDWLNGEMGLRYGYENLNARDEDFNPDYGRKNANASSLTYTIQRDLRDNPLYPHSGYQLVGHVEVASDALGGDVNYERVDLGANFHHTFSTYQVLHASISHGFVSPVGSASEDLPFNKRFFPGGENTVRGYQQGEATPRDEFGRNIGAESFLLLNLELEQPIANDWSLVVFSDTVGVAADLDNYPFNEILTSVGGGIRWSSIIGPVRLEYGYNLNRRSQDPHGTLHFSIGFPF